MADDGLMYDVMVERARRGVLREALSYIAENGLPGDHHLYITFRTDHPDVEISDVLHDRYPGEMTIVLQHQFWDLEVSEDLFSVTLSFADVPYRLGIPFASVIAFFDPSVRFGLQFDTARGEEDAAETRPTAEVEILPFGGEEAESQASEAPAAAGTKPKAPGTGDEAEPTPSSEAGEEDAEKVVTLDRFRKK